MRQGKECRRVLKTGLSRINLANARHQVVQVCFCTFENVVAACAVLSPVVLPALALMADLPGGNDMLPLDTGRTASVLARDVAAGCEVDAIAGVFAAAIKLGGL